MSSDFPRSGDGEFDADLEARLVALILGEASEFEREALERLMTKRPEVAEMKQRLEAVHGLVGDAVELEHPETGAWKLAPERRAHVMKTLGIGNGPTREPNGNGSRAGAAKETRIRRASRKVMWAAAACFMVNLVLFAWLVGMLNRSEKGESLSARKPITMILDSSGSEAPSSLDIIGNAKSDGDVIRREVPPVIEGGNLRPAAFLPQDPNAPEAGAVRGGKMEGGGDRAESALAKLRKSLGGDADEKEIAEQAADGTRIMRDALAELSEKPVLRGGMVAEDGESAAVVGGKSGPLEEAKQGLLPSLDGPDEPSAPSDPPATVSPPALQPAERYREATDKEVLASQEAAGKDLSLSVRDLSDSKEVAGEIEKNLVRSGLSLVPGDDDPIRSAPGLRYETTQDVDKVRRHLYTAEGYKNLGLYDEAIREYQGTLRTDPHNTAARRGMEQIHKLKSDHYRSAYDEGRARLLSQVDQAWDLAVPPPRGEIAGRSDGRRIGPRPRPKTPVNRVEQKLKEVIIPEINFDDTTVEEAVDFLRQRARELDTTADDPSKKGISFVIRKPRLDGGAALDGELDAEGGLGAVDPGTARVKELKLKNVTVEEALKAIADQSRLRYKVDEHAVTLLPMGSGEGDDILTRKWRVGRNFLADIQAGGAGDEEADPFAADDTGLGGGSLKPRRALIDILKETGIDFPPGASAQFIPSTGTIIVSNTPQNLDLMDQIAEMTKDSAPPVDFEKLDSLFQRRENGELDGKGGAAARIHSKLENIIIPVIDFDDTSVEEAVDFLRQRTRELDSFELDPSKQGVSFRIKSPRVEQGEDEELDAEGGLGSIDPGQARVKELKLRNVPLSKALQYICDQARLRYKIDENGITLLPIVSGGYEDIETRSWAVHPDVMEKVRSPYGEGTGDPDPFGNEEPREPMTEAEREEFRQEMMDRPLMDILKDAGIDFPPGATISYDRTTGVLIAKNTPAQHDLVDQLLESIALDMSEVDVARETLEQRAQEESFSTFSLHISDVSFKLAKATLEKGQWPAAGQVRVEEFVNAFDYDDPRPRMEERVACQLEQAAHPFMQQRNLVRISMRTAALGRAGGTPLRLTVLLDNSGSMERADRAESVQRAFDLLAAQLTEADVVTLISFARRPRLLADRIRGNEAGELSKLVARTPSEGGTNLEEALRLGLSKAHEQKVEGGINRIILLTDGAANLGNAKPEDLAKLVETMREQGIAFDACGVGAEGLNDEILESLTRKGDGRYYFLDRPEDADAGFARQIAGALRPAARNVKVQVEFNPRRVGYYKLYGFEKHVLKKEDFRDDSVDAAEMAAEEAGNAVYHVEVRPEGEGEIGAVSVRFQDTATGRMVERRWTIPYEGNVPPLSEAAPSMRLAGSAALFGEKLNGGPLGERVRMAELVRLVNPLASAYPASERVRELIGMVAKARELER